MADPSARESKQRSNRYGRMFSAFAFGIYFLISGLIGFNADLKSATRWADGPILWEIVVGVGLLFLAVFWYHRLADPRLNVFRRSPPRIKNVGAGKSAGALRQARKQLEDGPT